jgi:uncharacterized membrane protein
MRTAASTHAAKGIGFERFIFFSDAVFAIAITLLVLDLKLPAGQNGPLVWAPLIPKLIGFGLSFYVIGRYWLSHHALFEAVQGYDRPLLWVNLAFLAGVAFLPFPTSVVIQLPAGSGAVGFYALSLAGVGLLMLALVLTARRPHLLAPEATRGETVHLAIATAGAPLVFLLTAAVAVVWPREALWMLLLLSPVGWLCERLGRIVRRRVDAVG